MIKGPKTRLGPVVGLAVDPVRNLLAVANSKDILIFNRTDAGMWFSARAHRWPEDRISDGPWQM